MPIDKSPLVIKEFKGKLVTDADPLDTTLGEIEQVKVPFEYALNSVNLDYLKKGGMRTRNGIDKYMAISTVGKPRQMWRIENLNGTQYTDRWLIFTHDGANGRLYDTGVTAPATNPILTTVASVNYLNVANFFGKIFITEWDSWMIPTGIRDVKIYNGLYNVRNAKGALPVVGAFAVAAAAGGVCTPGLHLVSVIFETDTGYLTGCVAAHVATPLTVTTTAANATVQVTNCPVGAAGSGVIRRHIIMSKIVVNNNGLGFNSYEPYIAYTVNDNVTVNFSFSVPDSALVESAKSYMDNGTSIRNCIGFATLGNRMVYLAPRADVANPVIIPSRILVSPPNRPEQVVSLPRGRTGISADNESTVWIGQDYSGTIAAGAELNGVLYIFKEDSTFAVVADDELSPNEWQDPVLIDSGKGAYPFGVSIIGNSPSHNTEGSFLVSGNHGIRYFNGKFSQRSIAESIWDEYEISDLKWIKVVVEPVRQIMFVRIGDPASDNLALPHGANRSILMANYYYGVDVTTIRWGEFKYLVDQAGNPLVSIYDIALREPTTAGNDGAGIDYNSDYSLLAILYAILNQGANYFAKIYSEAMEDRDFAATLGANGVFPRWEYETGYTPNNAGEVYNFGPVKIRVRVDAGGVLGIPAGLEVIVVEKCLFDSGTWTTIGTFAPGAFPGKYFSLNMNAVSEHMRLRVSGQNRALVDELVLHMVDVAKDRPRV